MTGDSKKSKEQLLKELSELKESLNKSEAEVHQLKAIFDALGDGITVQDPNFKVLYQNRVLKDLMGVHEGELCYAVYHHRDERCDDCHLVQSVTHDKIVKKERLKKTPTGEVCLEITEAPIKNSSGEILGGVGIVRDITDRKLAEEALRESEERYRSFFEDSPISLWELDFSRIKRTIDDLHENGVNDFKIYLEDHFNTLFHCVDLMKVVDVNKATLYLFQAKSKEDFTGHLQNLFSEGAHEILQDLIVSISEGNTVFEGEGNTRTFEGNKKYVSFKWSVAPGHEETLSKVLISIIDISKRKQAEEELVRVQKLESLGVLAGGIAHDFNNLLAAILGNVSLVKLGVNPEHEHHRRLTEAEDATLRSKNLTHQLLSFSRGGTLVKKIDSMKDLLKEAVSFALSGSNVRCDFFIADDLWPIYVDPGQINRVIHNVIINADQAMPDGGTIEVAADNLELQSDDHLHLPKGKFVRVSINDHGKGIAEEDLPKIFDPYFTSHDLGAQKGQGLGLAITHTIIKEHQGYVEMDSKVGVGSTFTFFLPASEEEVVTEGVVIEKGQEDVVLYGKGKILVMDDEEMVRLTISEMVEFLGYEAVCAEDGAETIALYKKAKSTGAPFNTIIMDVTIPGGMGAEETIKELLAIDPEVNAVVSSGYSNKPILSDYKKYGFQAAIRKPYKIQELSHILYKITAQI